jgi:simple sugar transport system permease protein
MIAGVNPVLTWRVLIVHTLGDWQGISEVLLYAIPLMLVAAGVCVAFRGGLFNIGGDGQLIAGALTAVALAPVCAEFGVFALPIFLLLGALGGAMIGGLVGWLRARFTANEIIVTIMLNYVLMQILAWAIRAPLQEPMKIFPRSASLDPSLHLSIIDVNSQLHSGLWLALATLAVVQLVLSRSAFGFRVSAIGSNAEAAHYAGISRGLTVMGAMALSGALGGLAGAVEIAGVFHRLEDNFSSGIGLSAIAVALMARLQPAWVPLSALLFSVFQVGSGALQRQLDLPFPIVWIIQASVILAFLCHRPGTRQS